MATKDDAIFEYSDYRRFLRDFYRARKASEAGFSYRLFSRRAKLGSPNYLKLVIDGERNLSPKMARRFGEACGLEGDALECFEALVSCVEAADPAERERSRKRLARFRQRRQVHRIAEDRAAYYSSWYVSVIRELCVCPGFRESPAWIAKQLVPRIRASEARRAVELLLRLGMLVRDEEGRLRQSEALVTSGAEASRSLVAEYHRVMMRHAGESIDRVPREQRDISSLTVALSAEGLERFKKRLQEFRRELLAMSAEEPVPARVVQLNMQLFPLSHIVPAPDAKDPT